MSAPRIRGLIGTAAWLALATAVACAYWPSLLQIPRWDQWWYLADTYGHDEFLDLLARTYSWNRTCALFAWERDTALFRPLLFAVLAAEKAWIGPRQELIQAAGIVLHLVICGLLYAVFRQLHRLARVPRGARGPDGSDVACGTEGAVDSAAAGESLGRLPSPAAVLAFALTAFFALSPSVLMKVVWTHIHGYLIFDALLLAALLLVLGTTIEPDGRRATRATWFAWGLLFAAAFAYEMGQFVAVLFGLHAFAVRAARGDPASGLRAFVLFASIFVLYQVANRLDLRYHLARGRCAVPSSDLLAAENLARTPQHAARFCVYHVVQPWIPRSVAVDGGVGRYADVGESVWTELTVPAARTGPRVAALLGLAAVVVVVAVASIRAGRRWDRVRLATVALCAALPGLYGAIVVLGRWNRRPESISDHSYTVYFELMLVLVAAYSIASGAFREGPRGRLVRWAFAAALLLLAVRGALLLRATNEWSVERYSWWHRQSLALRAFVAAHESEPGFSFEVDARASDPVLVEVGIESHTLLFSKWTSHAAPGTARWRIVFRGTDLVAQDRFARRPE